MERLRILRTAPGRELRKQVAILSRKSQNWRRANAVSVNRTRYAATPPASRQERVTRCQERVTRCKCFYFYPFTKAESREPYGGISSDVP